MLKIAAFTGSSLRHRRLIHKINSELDTDVKILWVRSKGVKNSKQKINRERVKPTPSKPSLLKSLLGLSSKIKTLGLKKATKLLFYSFFEKAFKKPLLLFHNLMILREEKKLIPLYPDAELNLYKSIETSDPNSSEIEKVVNDFSPDVFVSFGGPIYREGLYASSKVTLNQHAGMSPKYKGSYTTEQALINGDLKDIGCTVHFISNEADEGAIVSVNTLIMNELDSPARIFVKNCALGTDNLVMALKSFVKKGAIEAIPQERTGRTYFAKEFGAAEIASLYSLYYFGGMMRKIRRLNNEG
ncbi:formyltransferase family protein [Pseudoalteromonas sp. SSDWG2]|uniref:formyltransferase family protein n=1 Tax=Pseudoalteromonas sp. SSDWG2 TaxID=3139391 RepID=UPI003BACC645